MEDRAHERLAQFLTEVPELARDYVAYHIGMKHPLEQATDDQLDAMRAVYEAGSLGLIGPDSMANLVVKPEHLKAMEDRIKAQHGAAAAVKLAAARWALTLGKRDEWKPHTKTMKAAAAHPILGPCLAFGKAIHTPDAVDAPDVPDGA
jgi:hypothetical protein